MNVRLIEADALLNECEECQKTDPLFEGRGWASHFINDAGEPSTEWYCVEDMIENATTIPAIPVDWLKEQRDKRRAAAAAHSNISSMTVLEAINVVLDLWEKEG